MLASDGPVQPIKLLLDENLSPAIGVRPRNVSPPSRPSSTRRSISLRRRLPASVEWVLQALEDGGEHLAVEP
jgi:hypothetical protein